MIARIALFLCLWLAAAADAATYTVVANRDSYLRQNEANNNFGSDSELDIRTSSTNSRRPIIGFTLPAIPAGEIIISATLRVWVTDESNDNVTLHRVTDSWTENGVTWNNTAADFDAAAEDTIYISSSGVHVSFNVSSLVNRWRTGAVPNHGVMLIGDSGSDSAISSRESGTSSRRPLLTIVTAPFVPLTAVKSSQPYSDPYNGTANPKLIPGGFVAYTVTVSNGATYGVDNNAVVVTDATPSGLRLFVGDVPGGSGPVLFVQGGSGLAYTFTSLGSTTDDVDFSNNGGATWTYTPVPNSDQVDPNVTNIRIRPRGAMAAGSSFNLLFGYQVQ